MPRNTDSLEERYARFLKRQGKDWSNRCAAVCRERERTLRSLRRRDVITVADLVERFPTLSPSLKRSATDLIAIFDIRSAIPVLLAALPDRAVRLSCAAVLGGLELSAKAKRTILEIGRRELLSDRPDREWLESIIHALGYLDDPDAAELVVTIFERQDLPGSLRGEAGDKLGCNELVHDRRTAVYRRCRDTALRGITESSIHVQFWSMYVVASYCNVKGFGRKVDPVFRTALPALREIAARDHRLAPGYWWPMSAEAEDAIGCIENGELPIPAAPERWEGNPARGNMTDE